MFFEPNDIVINFKKALIHPWNIESTKHLNKFMFSCRLATNAEIELYLTAKQEIVKYKDLGIKKNKISKNAADVQFSLSSSNLRRIKRVGEEIGTDDYNAIVNKLIEVFFSPETKNIELVEQLKKELVTVKKYKKKTKRFFQIMEELKNE